MSKEFKALRPHGKDPIFFQNKDEAMGWTYTANDGSIPSFPLDFEDNPYSDECMNAKNLFEIGMGVGRNAIGIHKNTNIHYHGLEPNESMGKWFWEWNDKKYEERTSLYTNWDEIEKGTKFDVMLSTFVLQHITYKNPSAWNVSDIVNKMKEYAHEDTTWILYEHDGEYGGWIDKMFNECGITPEVYQRGYTGIEDHTHRDNSVGNRQGHHLIIWRGV